MKKPSKVTTITGTIFLSIFLIAFLLVKPLFKKLNQVVDEYKNQVIEQVTKYTGLTLSYDSISPSIFSYFSIKGIKLITPDNQSVIEIKNTHLSYNLFSLLKSDYSNFITGITIEGVDVDVMHTIDLINQLKLVIKKRKDITLEQIMGVLPVNTTLKNFSINYSNNKIDCSVLLKEIKVLNTRQKEFLDFELNSRAFISSSTFNKIEGDINFNGSISKNLEDSFIYISLSDFTNKNFKLNKINLLTSFADNKLNLRTIQSIYPLSFSAVYDILSNNISAELITDNISPVSVFSTLKKNDKTKALKKMNITLNAKVDYDIALNKIKYSSNGKANIPDEFIPKGAVVEYDVLGDEKTVFLNNSINGDFCSAVMNLDYTFENYNLSGVADLQKLLLPNGQTVSSEIYFDPLEKSGFMIFSPQVFIGNQALTALQARVMPQNDSIDFDFEVTDFSHIAENNQGVVKLDGSYLLSSKYIQTSVSLNSIYLETILSITQELLDPALAQKIENSKNSLSSFMFSGDAYVSTDFKSLSYNLPYIVIANTKAENLFVLLSINGNEQTVQMNRFDMVYNQHALSATASFDMIPGSKDKFFDIDILSSTIPYHFSGSIMPEVVSLTGDYGTDVEIRFLKNKNLDGYFVFENLPFIIGENTFITTVYSDFVYSPESGPEVNINKIQVERNDVQSSVNPVLLMSGNATKYGAQLSSISYIDLYSSLTGNADLTININDSIFNSGAIKLELNDDSTKEKLLLDANVSNPELKKLNGTNIFDSLYIDALFETSHFSLNRFTKNNNKNNEVSANAYLSGTLDTPYAAVNIDNLSFLVNDEIMNANGSVILEEKLVTINNFELNGSSFSVNDVTGMASISDFTGQMNAVLKTKGTKDINMPLELRILDSYIPEDKKIPDSITINLSCPELGGSLIKNPVPFDITFMYTTDFVSFFSSENIGLYGTYDKQNGLQSSWNMNDIINCDITGNFANNNQNIKVSSVNIDLSKLFKNLDIDDFIQIEKGIMKGSLTINGPLDTPEFKGALSIAEPVFTLPILFKQKISTDKILITASNNEIVVSEKTYLLKNSPKFNFGTHVYLNKWIFDHIDLSVNTLPGEMVSLFFNVPALTLEGDVICDLKLTWENYIWDFTGDIFTENLEIVSDLTTLSTINSEEKIDKNNVNLRTNIKLVTGTHAMLNFNPLLRCVFVPNTTIDCQIDTETQTYKLDGLLNLKSGDVAYLNRSFYIKEGSIKFNPDDITNPLVTIKAETREKDSNGQTVRIILSAENQFLLDFEPIFSSVPAKSENEIRALLGQIVIADSQTMGQLMLSAGDYYLQSTVMREVENKLRDLMNFDIFSVRTNILKNTVNLGNKNEQSKEITIGNFLDNSTVYIGKYIGSALYVDAMLNMNATDNPGTDYLSASSLSFQPEIGLELELPVINVRWDMAWNFTPGIQLQSFVPSTTISLSWKFSF